MGEEFGSIPVEFRDLEYTRRLLETPAGGGDNNTGSVRAETSRDHSTVLSTPVASRDEAFYL